MPNLTVHAEDPLFGLYRGFVQDHVDPEKRGRVTARVPGIISGYTRWAAPLGWPASGGQPGESSYVPPLAGAAIAVGFFRGDVDDPFYLTGAPTSEAATPPTLRDRTELTKPHDRGFETFTYEIVVTEQGAADTRIVIRDKRNGAYIEMVDRFQEAGGTTRNNTITLYSPTALHIRTDGILQLDGAVVQIGRRRVVPYGDRI